MYCTTYVYYVLAIAIAIVIYYLLCVMCYVLCVSYSNVVIAMPTQPPPLPSSAMAVVSGRTCVRGTGGLGRAVQVGGYR